MALTDYVSIIGNFVTGLIKPEEKQHEQLSMVELCIKYLPQSAFTDVFGSGATLMKMEQVCSELADLNDEEVYANVTKNYGLSDKKARDFVRDSRSFRQDARTLRKLEKEILRNEIK